MQTRSVHKEPYTRATWTGSYIQCPLVDYLTQIGELYECSYVEDTFNIPNKSTIIFYPDHLEFNENRQFFSGISLRVASDQDFYIHMYENPTVVSKGDLLTAINKNRVCKCSNHIDFFHNGEISDTGTHLWSLYIKEADRIPLEWSFLQVPYAFVFEGTLYGQQHPLSVYLEWYEVLFNVET